MSRREYINIELNVDDALDMILAEISIDTLLSKLDKSHIIDFIDTDDFIDHRGSDKVLETFTDSEIEQEYLNRTPLARSMSEI